MMMGLPLDIHNCFIPGRDWACNVNQNIIVSCHAPSQKSGGGGGEHTYPYTQDFEKCTTASDENQNKIETGLLIKRSSSTLRGRKSASQLIKRSAPRCGRRNYLNR